MIFKHKLKQITKFEDLCDYREAYYVPRLGELDCRLILDELKSMGNDLFVEESSDAPKYLVRIACTDTTDGEISILERIGKELDFEGTYAVCSSLEDVISLIVAAKREDLVCAVNSAYLEEVVSVSNLDEIKELTNNYNKLKGTLNYLECGKQPMTYTLEYWREVSNDERADDSLNFAHNYRRNEALRDLVEGFLEENPNSVRLLYTQKGEDKKTYILTNDNECLYFNGFLDEFDVLELHAWDRKTNQTDTLSIELKEKPIQRVYTVAFDLIDCSTGKFDDKVEVFNSYNRALAKYKGLTRPYVDTYGPESGYKLSDKDYYEEFSIGEDKLIKLFRARIVDEENNYKFQYRCSLRVKELDL